MHPEPQARKESHPMFLTLILVALALYLGAVVLPALVAGLVGGDR